jgi:hypothetical protein
MLESNLSADAGDGADGQGCYGPALCLCTRCAVHNMINSPLAPQNQLAL